MVSDKDTNLFWVDLEMTGLDPNENVILEIACLITNVDLNVISEGFELVIYQPDEQLDQISLKVKGLLQKDLIEKVKSSKISVDRAENLVLDFVKNYCNMGTSPYCGNTVSTDKQFIKKYMPNLANYLHYRLIDVSTVKELAKRWYPKLPLYIKKENHRALEDIKESIEELKYYREKIFKSSEL